MGVDEEVGLEDFEISADINEAKSMVCGGCGFLNGGVWWAVVGKIW